MHTPLSGLAAGSLNQSFAHTPSACMICDTDIRQVGSIVAVACKHAHGSEPACKATQSDCDYDCKFFNLQNQQCKMLKAIKGAHRWCQAQRIDNFLVFIATAQLSFAKALWPLV